MSNDASPLNPELFAPSAVAAETRALNKKLIELMTPLPEWWDVGAERVREARRLGEGAFPAPAMSERAHTRTIEGRDGRRIPLRVLAPDNPLLKLDNVVLTAHFAGPTWDNHVARFRNAFDNVQRVARGEGPLWVVPELQ